MWNQIKVPNYAIEDTGDADDPGRYRVLRIDVIEKDDRVAVKAEQIAAFRNWKHAADWADTYRGMALGVAS